MSVPSWGNAFAGWGQYSGHTSVASLARYARVSAEALARWQAGRDPAARKR
ncbi:hypothetical protein [Streptosporangium sp. KLBMP 9127]|nr:hypothetical protein [Streptosporangium sp. KLBMP 9127]